MKSVAEFLLLAEAVALVYKTQTEYTEESFQELTTDQYEAYRRQGHPADHAVYRVLALEPGIKEGYSMELPAVREPEKQAMINATKMIYRYCQGATQTFETFEDRLRYAAQMMPNEILPPEFQRKT